MDLKKKLYDKIRAQGKSDGTSEIYWSWTDRYLKFCKSKGIGKETPAEIAVEEFLTMLATVEDVSANTQNQAFSAICYTYRHVLKRPLVNVSALRAKRPDRVREIADHSEIEAIFDELRGPARLVAELIYGCSCRIGETGKIRIKDICKARKHLIIRGAKGEKDRIVGYPECLHDAVDRQIESMRVLWRHDVAEGLNGVSLPKAFGRKSSRSHLDFRWYYLFSADEPSRCPVSGRLLRHHRDMNHIGRQIKEASNRAGVMKRITSHCLRHSHATHSLEMGVPIHHVQQRMGHTSLETTRTYLHVSKDGITSAKSPLESLLANPPHREKPTAEPFKLRVVG